MESATTTHVRVGGTSRIMLSSNNYLGLANHPKVIEAIHTELEAELADWHGTEAAMIVTTGYRTDVGTVSALARPGDTIRPWQHRRAAVRLPPQPVEAPVRQGLPPDRVRAVR